MASTEMRTDEGERDDWNKGSFSRSTGTYETDTGYRSRFLNFINLLAFLGINGQNSSGNEWGDGGSRRVRNRRRQQKL